MKGSHYSTGESSSRLMLGLITDITERKQVEQDLRQANAKILRDSVLSRAVSEAQEKFISAENPLDSFNGFLTNLLSLTGSEYGFIDEMLYTADGAPYLIARAITNIAWSDDSRALSEAPVGRLPFRQAGVAIRGRDDHCGAGHRQ